MALPTQGGIKWNSQVTGTKQKRCLFTQCIVRLGSSLPQEKDAKIVCEFRQIWIPNYQHGLKLEKKSGKRPQRQKYQDPNQFVVTGSEQGFELWFEDGYWLSPK